MGLSQSELELVISARNVVWQHFSYNVILYIIQI